MQPVQIDQLQAGQHTSPKAKRASEAVSLDHRNRRGCVRTPEQTAVEHKLLAGALAGALAKTVIAPLDRVKILFQVGKEPFSYPAAYRLTKRIVVEDGALALWRGNGAMVLRVLPYAAINFASHDVYAQWLGVQEGGAPSDQVGLRFLSGAAAGITATICTYPLDIVRTRLAIDPAAQSVSSVMRSIVKSEGGVRSLFRGQLPTIAGIVPYSGTVWTTKEVLTENYSKWTGRELHTVDRLACSGAAGLAGQVVTYPLDVIRRRMQSRYAAESMLAVGAHLIREEGVFALYKGVSLNFLKGPLASAISFTLYDMILLHIRDSRRSEP